jgi:hypothetical protein
MKGKVTTGAGRAATGATATGGSGVVKGKVTTGAATAAAPPKKTAPPLQKEKKYQVQ